MVKIAFLLAFRYKPIFRDIILFAPRAELVLVLAGDRGLACQRLNASPLVMALEVEEVRSRKSTP